MNSETILKIFQEEICEYSRIFESNETTKYHVVIETAFPKNKFQIALTGGLNYGCIDKFFTIGFINEKKLRLVLKIIKPKLKESLKIDVTTYKNGNDKQLYLSIFGKGFNHFENFDFVEGVIEKSFSLKGGHSEKPVKFDVEHFDQTGEIKLLNDTPPIENKTFMDHETVLKIFQSELDENAEIYDYQNDGAALISVNSEKHGKRIFAVRCKEGKVLDVSSLIYRHFKNKVFTVYFTSESKLRLALRCIAFIYPKLEHTSVGATWKYLRIDSATKDFHRLESFDFELGVYKTYDTVGEYLIGQTNLYFDKEYFEQTGNIKVLPGTPKPLDLSVSYKPFPEPKPDPVVELVKQLVKVQQSNMELLWKHAPIMLLVFIFTVLMAVFLTK